MLKKRNEEFEHRLNQCEMYCRIEKKIEDEEASEKLIGKGKGSSSVEKKRKEVTLLKVEDPDAFPRKGRIDKGMEESF